VKKRGRSVTREVRRNSDPSKQSRDPRKGVGVGKVKVSKVPEFKKAMKHGAEMRRVHTEGISQKANMRSEGGGKTGALKRRELFWGQVEGGGLGGME